jgi:hypothetical protein
MDQYEDSAGSLARIARLNDDENRSKITGCNFNDDLGKAFESKNLPERLGAILNAIMRGKALYKTSTGYLAHVHGDVKVGDHIFVDRGATVPFIIRPTNNDDTFNDDK